MITKEELYEMYINQKMSSYKIAEKLGVCGVTVRRWLKDNNINIRTKYNHDTGELIHKKFNGLNITKCLGLKNGRFWYECECVKCGYKNQYSYSRIINYKVKCKVCYPKHNNNLKTGYGFITGTIFASIRYCAKARELEINVTPEYLNKLIEKQNFKCAISGVPIYIAQHIIERKNNQNTASLDRIDSSLGYVIGNVQWVHKDVNKLKTDFNQKDFIDLCHIISDYQRNKNET